MEENSSLFTGIGTACAFMDRAVEEVLEADRIVCMDDAICTSTLQAAAGTHKSAAGYPCGIVLQQFRARYNIPSITSLSLMRELKLSQESAGAD